MKRVLTGFIAELKDLTDKLVDLSKAKEEIEKRVNEAQFSIQDLVEIWNFCMLAQIGTQRSFYVYVKDVAEKIVLKTVKFSDQVYVAERTTSTCRKEAIDKIIDTLARGHNFIEQEEIDLLLKSPLGGLQVLGLFFQARHKFAKEEWESSIESKG